MEQSEIRYRNKIISDYHLSRTWDENKEFLLKSELIMSSKTLMPIYPYVVEDEWEVIADKSDEGMGDLVFTDGNGNFAVVEVKYLDLQSTGDTACSRRTKKRQKVKEQAVKYAEIYRKKKFVKSVKSFIFTNEMKRPREIRLVPRPTLRVNHAHV